MQCSRASLTSEDGYSLKGELMFTFVVCIGVLILFFDAAVR